MESVNRPQGRVFDEIAEAYDEAREGYPTEIVQAALEKGRVAQGARALEIGCGTGKLTEELVALGLRVDAVDPGARMIEVAQRRIGSTDMVKYHVGRFEDLDLPNETFDAVFSAAAFHWLDPSVSWRKVAAHLRPGGLLALLTHASVHDDRSEAAEIEFRTLLKEHAPSHKSWPPVPHLGDFLAEAKRRSGNASDVWDWVMLDGRHSLASEDAAELYESVELTTIVVDAERTADELEAHFRTTSLYVQIPPERRRAFEKEHRQLIEARGGSIQYSAAVVLMTAMRTPRRVKAHSERREVHRDDHLTDRG